MPVDENHEQRNEISLIIPEMVVTTVTSTDRAGGETHGIGSYIGERIRRWISKGVPENVLRPNLQACIEQLGGLLEHAQEKPLPGWGLEEISVSLAISAEGSVGIATAGAETSIEVTFRRSPKP